MTQQLIVLAVVAIALAYSGHRLWRTLAAGRRRKAGGCGTDCGCGDS